MGLLGEAAAAFAGKVALVTGAGSGIGLAVTQALAEAGATVWAADLQPPAASGNVRPIGLDVRDEASWQAALAKVPHLDFLVAAAGIASQGGVAETTLAEWRKVMAVNLDGAFLAVRESAVRMGEGGAMVLIGSASGIRPAAGAAAYCASKAGMAMLTKTAALEFKPRNIRVNALAPAGVATNLWRQTSFFQQAANEKGEAAAWELLGGVDPAKHPLQRMAFAEEVAQVVLFLLSPAAGQITGVELAADSGYTLG